MLECVRVSGCKSRASGGTYFLRKEVTRLDAIVIILKLAASAVGLAAAIVGLLREAVAFAKALWAHQKEDDR